MRREFSRKIKAQAIARANGCCERCHAVLKPREAEVDHILEDALGGEPILANAQTLCKPCHKAKTADRIAKIRKADRARDKASGAIKPAGKLRGPAFPKPDKPPREGKTPLAPRNLFTRISP